MTFLAPNAARTFWKALVDNASRLIADAQLLLDAGSTDRARSLSVLAMEELGKAVWIYDVFSEAWSDGREELMEVKKLSEFGTRHVKKYLEAYVFGDDLAAFWGDYSGYGDAPSDDAGFQAWLESRNRASEEAAHQANRDKQRGFYADLATQDQPAAEKDAVQGELSRSAQVIEMMLITDHSRMKLDSAQPYDSTDEQQWRLMPTSHPNEFASFIESGGSPAGPDDESEEE